MIKYPHFSVSSHPKCCPKQLTICIRKMYLCILYIKYFNSTYLAIVLSMRTRIRMSWVMRSQGGINQSLTTFNTIISNLCDVLFLPSVCCYICFEALTYAGASLWPPWSLTTSVSPAALSYKHININASVFCQYINCWFLEDAFKQQKYFEQEKMKLMRSFLAPLKDKCFMERGLTNITVVETDGQNNLQWPLSA